MNGSGNGRVTPSTDTCLSSIASSSAAFRRRAVDLIGEEDVGEDRTFPEGELGGTGFEYEGARHVPGHEVRRELYPLGVKAEGGGHAADQQCLRHPGNTFQKDMPPRQQGNEHPCHCCVLPDDGLGHFPAHCNEGTAGRICRMGVGGHR